MDTAKKLINHIKVNSEHNTLDLKAVMESIAEFSGEFAGIDHVETSKNIRMVVVFNDLSVLFIIVNSERFSMGSMPMEYVIGEHMDILAKQISDDINVRFVAGEFIETKKE